jgi:hypothetical protein
MPKEKKKQYCIRLPLYAIERIEKQAEKEFLLPTTYAAKLLMEKISQLED